MQKGFMYLTAIIYIYSRKIVSWGLSNTLDAEASLRVVRSAIEQYGSPEIINSDQGSQFTCGEYIELLKKEKIRISMDGRGRAIDNIYIERFWRSIKYRHIYLNPANDGLELFRGSPVFWMDGARGKSECRKKHVGVRAVGGGTEGVVKNGGGRSFSGRGSFLRLPQGLGLCNRDGGATGLLFARFIFPRVDFLISKIFVVGAP